MQADPESGLGWRRGEGERHRARETIPACRFRAEPPTASRRQSIVLRLAVVLRDAPLAVDEPLVLEAVQRRVQRTLLDLECAARDLADAKQHAVAVQLAERTGL